MTSSAWHGWGSWINHISCAGCAAEEIGAAWLPGLLLRSLMPCRRRRLPCTSRCCGCGPAFCGLASCRKPCLNSALLCAGRAAEEIIYGRDEMSTLNQRRLDTARQIAQKLIVSGGMSDLPDLHHRPLSQSYPSENGALVQIVPEEVSCWR